MTSPTSDNPTLSVPRDGNQIFTALFKEIGKPQQVIADGLECSRQFVSGILRGVETPSEEKLRRLCDFLERSPEQYINELHEYERWKKTPEGILYHQKGNHERLLNEFISRGTRRLLKQEVEEARKLGLIKITTGRGPDERLSGLGKYGFTCHYGRQVLSKRRPLETKPDSEGRSGIVILPARESVTVTSQETFKLSPHMTLDHIGIAQDVCEKGIRVWINSAKSFLQEERLCLTLDNTSNEDCELYEGCPLASVCVVFDPFAADA